MKRLGGRGRGRVEGSGKKDEREKEGCEKETCERVTEMGEFVAGREDKAEDGGDKDRVGDAFRGLRGYEIREKEERRKIPRDRHKDRRHGLSSV